MKGYIIMESKMRIAVLSGKGGTGKTLISVNLASVSEKAVYMDCDVEEPNGHLFLKPSNVKTSEITVKIPSINLEICDGCRKCIEFCKFNALAFIGGKVKVFDDVCHSCGGCSIVCPQNAITEMDKLIGMIEQGDSLDVNVISGILNTGEASGIPIIKGMLEKISDSDNTIIIDCPPGSACIVMESIKDADYCVLVAEPTLFGSHNLNMVYELVKLFDKPFGVVLNKSIEGYNPSREFCEKNNIKILGEIPFDSELGKLNSDAKIVSRETDKYHDIFKTLLDDIIKEAQNETIAHS